MSIGQVLDYQPQQTNQASRFAWLGWAIYLAMSWTWCIGMFLPVLLVRDYGIWGWVVFAVPNVIGAAAMGWMIRSSQASMQITGEHRFATVAFSAVTSCFQLFSALWILQWPWLQVGVLVVSVAVMIVSLRSDRWALAAAIVTLAASTIFIAVIVASQSADWVLPAPGIRAWKVELIALAPICAFGFLLCPYLDGTFHRARQRCSPRDSRLAFGVGFGGIFLSMITFSLFYAINRNLDYLAILLLCLYFMLQLAFTTGVHWRVVIHGERSRWLVRAGIVGSTILVVFGCSWISKRIPTPTIHVRDGGEVMYRLFMGFYGLVFPAYVWLCMIPGRGRVAPSERQWIIFTISVLLAAPMFFMGFILGRMLWLLPGLAVVLLARLFVPRVMPTPA